jgi:hypothetical protein
MGPVLRNAVVVFLFALAADALLRGRAPVHVMVPAVLGVLAGAMTYVHHRAPLQPSGAHDA